MNQGINRPQRKLEAHNCVAPCAASIVNARSERVREELIHLALDIGITPDKLMNNLIRAHEVIRTGLHAGVKLRKGETMKLPDQKTIDEAIAAVQKVVAERSKPRQLLLFE